MKVNQAPKQFLQLNSFDTIKDEVYKDFSVPPSYIDLMCLVIVMRHNLHTHLNRSYKYILVQVYSLSLSPYVRF